MSFIGLLFVSLALFLNLKSYKNVFFTSKKKKAEDEAKFNEAIEQLESNPLGEKILDANLVGISLYISLIMNFLFYLITSVVVNNPFMYALAVVLFLLNVAGIKFASKALVEKKFAINKLNKISVPLFTVYIIGFIALFFI